MDNEQDKEAVILNNAINCQKNLVDKWRQQSEALLFETIRSIDNISCQELFYTSKAQETISFPQYSLMSWGTNNALQRMIPDKFLSGPFKLFPSSPIGRNQADNLLLHAGILERAKKLENWVRQGLLSAKLSLINQKLDSGITKVLVLKSTYPELFCEALSLESREWMSGLQVNIDANREKELENRHFEMLPELVKQVDLFQDWGIRYSTTREIDNYFLDWAEIYLRRMWGQDILGREDVIGGRPFNLYLGMLVAVAARAQKHLCFAAILKRRHPHLNIRNILTTFAPVSEFIVGVAEQMDADTLEVQKLLAALTLDPFNKDRHTSVGDQAWAPLIQASNQSYILPLYGLEINPFLFLLRELRGKYRDDWDRLANRREERWIDDMKHIFPQPRWTSNARNLKLKSKTTVVTDLDYVTYDKQNNEFAIFQLKWQDPVGGDDRARRSAGKNFVEGANKWVCTVIDWLEKNSVDELAKRAGIKVAANPKVHLFVIGRYQAFFSGFAERDIRAVWIDWNSLLKIRLEKPTTSLSEFALEIKRKSAEMISSVDHESYVVPLGELAIILNPTSEPDNRQ